MEPSELRGLLDAHLDVVLPRVIEHARGVHLFVHAGAENDWIGPLMSLKGESADLFRRRVARHLEDETDRASGRMIRSLLSVGCTTILLGALFLFVAGAFLCSTTSTDKRFELTLGLVGGMIALMIFVDLIASASKIGKYLVMRSRRNRYRTMSGLR
jgi:hypothetical protein